MALGALPSDVLRSIFFDGMRPILLGLLAGLAGGAICGQLIRSELFGVQPFDFTIFAAVGLLVLIVSAGACTFPVWRAMRVDPVVALRYE